MDREVSTASPLIAVVVCTYNRADRLRLCLTSLGAQTLPAAHWSIIVVDDGSSDSTPVVTQEFVGRLDQLTVIRQANAGLGAARNTGWRATRAPLVAFLDDDAIAPKDWLEKILATFASASPKLAVLGGPVDPEWETPPPAWLSPELLIWLTVFDLGGAAVTANDRPLFAGANMTFRSASLQDVDGFPTNLGRRGTSLLSHEESAIWSALAARGWTNAYQPDLRVRHFVPTARLRPSWFRRRLFWEGVCVARRNHPWTPEMKFRHRVRRWLGVAWSHLSARKFLHTLVRPWRWPRAVTWQTDGAYQFGFLCEALRTLFAPSSLPK